ncbi:hypothetical protein TNCV_1059061 [Trichonephila clavipes]|nr:hypothetical protein TNCV_1059061 [Trichonephila clavipes]
MEQACDRRLQLFVVAKTLTGRQEFLEVLENGKIAGSKIKAVGGDQTTPSQIPSKLLRCVEAYNSLPELLQRVPVTQHLDECMMEHQHIFRLPGASTSMLHITGGDLDVVKLLFDLHFRWTTILGFLFLKPRAITYV